MNWQQTYGYPIWYPLAFLVLILGIPAFIIAAIATGEWRLLIVALACYFAIASK